MDLNAYDVCYVTTTGRVSGLPRTIEIWFAFRTGTVFLLSGGGNRSDWVRNMQREPLVDVRIGDRSFCGRARIVDDAQERQLARELLFAKYQASYGGNLSAWRDAALPVAIDLDEPPIGK